MKKLFTLAAILAGVWCGASAATVTDVLSPSIVAPSASVGEKVDVDYTGPSGAVYHIEAVVKDNDGWTYGPSYAAGWLYVVTPPTDGVVSSFVAGGNYSTQPVFASVEAVSVPGYGNSDAPDGNNIGLKISGYQSGVEFDVKDLDYKYIYFQIYDPGNAPQITWSIGGDQPQPGPDFAAVDKITLESIKAQCADLYINPDNSTYNIAETNNVEYTAESGAKYELFQVYGCEALTPNWYAFDWNSQQGYLLVTAPAGENYIHSIKLTALNEQGAEYGTGFTVYSSANAFTFGDRNESARNQYVSSSKSEVVFEYPTKYILINCTQMRISDITVNWTETAPVPTCVTPEVQCWNHVTGGNLSVNLPYDQRNEPYVLKGVIADGETIVDVDWNFAENEGNGYSYTITGKAGETLEYELYYTAEGYNDSEAATGSFEIEMPQAEQPAITMPSPIFNGAQIVFDVPRNDETQEPLYENATVEYRICYCNDWTPVEGMTVTGIITEFPYVYTIEGAEVGQQIDVYAKLSCEGYKTSSERNVYGTVIDSKIPTPTFSVENGAVLEAGSTVSINKPGEAAELHYTVNGGEEQISTEMNVAVTITENTIIEAWATREGMETSDKATLEVSVENYGTDVDILTSDLFGEQTNGAKTNYNWKSENTSVDYNAYSGIWNNCFYMESSLTNTETAYVANGINTAKITGIRVDGQNQAITCTIYFANEPMTNTSENVNSQLFEDIDFDVMVISSDDGWNDSHSNVGYCVGKPGEWIDLAKAQADGDNEGVELKCAGYTNFYIRNWYYGNSMYLRRILIRYEDVEGGVDSIADNDDEANAVYYNLNGIRVDKDNLNPGLYIRVAGGNASKVLVK